MTREPSLFKELLHFYYGRNMIEDQDLQAKLGRYLRFISLSFNLNGNVEIKVRLCVILQHNTVEPGILV